MNVKKQQMRLQLQQQQPPQMRHNRTGFETLMDQSSAERRDASSPPAPILSRGGSVSRSSADRRPDGHHQHRGNRYEPQRSPAASRSPAAAAVQDDASGGGDEAKTVSGPAVLATSPLSLPSPYYDRNPVVAFPFHHYHHGPKSPAIGSVPLANVQNVAYADQSDPGDHYANNSKFFYPRHHHSHNYKPDGLDDDKENITQQDPESLQQQLDEVLRACADYEERHRGRQQVPAESTGNTSPEAAATTPPQQNRIKTNGSLPRDAKSPGAETSSPVTTSPPSAATWPSGSASTPSPTVLSPLSPTVLSPLSPTVLSPLSPTVLSPLSPTVLSPLSPPALTPLSLNATTGGDQAHLENGCFSTPPPATVAACESPRTRIKTLVPCSPMSASSPDTSSADQQQNSCSKNHYTRSFSHHNDNDSNNYGSPNSVSLSKSPELLKRQLSPVLLQSNLKSPSWQTTTSWLRSSPFATTADSTDGGGGGGGTAAAPTVSEKAAEHRRKLLVELSAHKSRLVELHLRREEVDRELIIETALLRAELDAADDETRQSENIVDGLDRAVAECRQQMDLCTVKQQEQTKAADSQLTGYRRELQDSFILNHQYIFLIILFFMTNHQGRIYGGGSRR